MPKNPFQLAFPAAVQFFKSKKILPTNTWKDVAEQYQAIAFTIAGITKASLLSDIKSIIEKQLESGISPEQFRSNFREAMTRAGWNPEFTPYRVNLILSQNVRSAYGFGRIEQMRSPDVIKKRRYWQWSHRDSPMFRPNHKAIDQKVFEADHPFFQTAFPPCFPPGTLVATPSGWKAIEKIQSGELVIGGSGNSQPVTATHITPYNGEVVRVVTEGSLETLATPNHRFLTLRGWIRAENLQIDDVLVQISEASFLNVPISNVNQLNPILSDCLVPIPVKRQSTQSEALNPQVNFRQKDVNPVALNSVIMDGIKTKSLQVIEQNTFNSRTIPEVASGMSCRELRLSWSSQSIDVSFGELSQGFEAGESALFAYFGIEEGRRLLEFFGSAPSSLISILRLTQAGVRLAFVLPLVSYLCQYLTAQFSSFRIVSPLMSNSFAGVAGFNSEVLHQAHQGSRVHTPASAQLPYRHPFGDIEVEEGFASGAPLDGFDSLDSFRAWSASHAILRQVKNDTSTLYSGSGCNLTVTNDETYCLQASVVHNCGFGCRCAVFALNERDLAREGLTVSEPPDPKTIADPGFKSFPPSLDQQRTQLLEDAKKRLPSNLRRLLEQDIGNLDNTES